MKVDKSKFGPGPWRYEPDKYHWVDPETKLDCLIVRNERMGNLCGYVGVPKDHPLFGKDYDDVDVIVHGGLTYSNECRGHICHDAAQEVWWFGFDCGHCDDLIPSLAWCGGVYRTFTYVTLECLALAQQIAVRGIPR